MLVLPPLFYTELELLLLLYLRFLVMIGWRMTTTTSYKTINPHIDTNRGSA